MTCTFWTVKNVMMRNILSEKINETIVFLGKVSIFDIGNISYPIIDNPLRQCILKPWCFAAVTRSFSQTISNQWRKNTLSKQLGKIPKLLESNLTHTNQKVLSFKLQYTDGTKFALRKNCYEIWKIRSQPLFWITRRIIHRWNWN